MNSQCSLKEIEDNNNDKKIELTNEKYLELVSAKIVFDVIKNSINIVQNEISISNKQNNEAKGDEQTKHVISNHVNMKKYFNTKRWNCISRPQYKYSCGISSLVSCWNYLYSTLGYGDLKPISQEEAMNILGFSEPYDQIRFGPFTGNKTLLKWFNQLNLHFNMSGKGSFFYKPVGYNKTIGLNSQKAKENLFDLIKCKNSAFIYHCYNHYCCIIGYERESIECTKAYDFQDNSHNLIDWILIADTSRKYQPFHCVKWDDIVKDLNLKSPEYLNIRNLDMGIQLRKDSSNNKSHLAINNENLHCILKFEKFKIQKQFSDINQYDFSILKELSNINSTINEQEIDLNYDDIE